MAGLNSLQSLDLSGTGVTDAGLRQLAGLNSLQSLYLGSTQVTDAGLKDLVGLRSLRSLSLGNTKVTDAGVAELNRSPRLCDRALMDRREKRLAGCNGPAKV